MAFIADSVLDAALNDLNDCDELFFCSQEPTTYAEASSTYALADGTPSFAALANGDTSGRKLTLSAGTVTGSGSGTATHWAACVNSGSVLKATNALSASVATTNAVDIDYNAVDVLEIRDAASE